MNDRTIHVERAFAALVIAAGAVYGGIPAAFAGTSAPNACNVFTRGDAERALHGPVVFQPNPIDKTICSWSLAKDSRVGVTVTRGPRSDWYPPKPGDMATSKVHHVPGVGQDAYTSYKNAGYGGVYDADVLTAKGVTTVTVTETTGNAAAALAIARSVMNR